MECIKGTIGIRGCASVTATLGHYINELPGISQVSMGQMADAEQSTFLGVWSDVEDRAALRFATDFAMYMRKKYAMNRVIDSFSVSKRGIDTDTTLAPVTDEYRGLLLTANYYGSILLCQHIQSISFYLQTVPDTVDATIKVYDIVGTEKTVGSVLDTFTIAHDDLVVGWNTKVINTTYLDSDAVFIGVDCSDFTTSSLTILSYVCGGGQLDGAKLVDGDITTGNETYGVTVIANIQCKYEAFVCANLEVFTDAWMQLLGAELMMERMHSPRVVPYTTVDLAKARELHEHFETKYKEKMLDIVESLDIPCDDCIECGEQHTTKYVLP